MSESSKKATAEQVRALADLFLLRERLQSEGEPELLKKIALCQEPLMLKCTICRTQVEVKQRCKRKWCPCCQRQLAAQRSAELAFIVERFRWPLFVTLTMKNVAEISSSDVRKLRRAFGKLRHRRFWKDTVKGGVAAIEIVNTGNGWHPHLHAVVDCQWLSIKTKPPPRGSTKAEWAEAVKASAQEVERHWSKCIGQVTSSVKVKRAGSLTIAKEVLKYSVTSESLIQSEEPVGPLIRALESCRLMTTFGRAHGQCVKEVRAAAKDSAKMKRAAEAEEMEPRCTCGAEEFMPIDLVKPMFALEETRADRQQMIACLKAGRVGK